MHPLLDVTQARLQMEQRHRDAAAQRRARQVPRPPWRARLAAALLAAANRLEPRAGERGRVLAPRLR